MTRNDTKLHFLATCLVGLMGIADSHDCFLEVDGFADGNPNRYW